MKNLHYNFLCYTHFNTMNSCLSIPALRDKDLKFIICGMKRNTKYVSFTSKNALF